MLQEPNDEELPDACSRSLSLCRFLKERAIKSGKVDIPDELAGPVPFEYLPLRLLNHSLHRILII